MAESRPDGVAIRVEDLAKHFGDVKAIDGVSFEVPRGTIFGLLGPNGSGKTTTVRVLATILRPDRGRAEVMGYDVVRQPDEVRYQIGMAGQSAAVDANLTGLENLQLVGRLAQLATRDVRARAVELLARFDLEEAGDRPVRTYSGGMRRRLDVAASLVARPPVLFLDEPTTGLDIQSRTELWGVIRELVADGATVLLTTQYLEEADRLADRVAVVDVGRVVANDTPAALKARLGATVIELAFADAAASEKALAILSPLVSGGVEREGLDVRLTANDGARVLMEALRRLDGAGLAPGGVSVREPSLDDVFLRLTGHHAEATGPSAADGARSVR